MVAVSKDNPFEVEHDDFGPTVAIDSASGYAGV